MPKSIPKSKSEIDDIFESKGKANALPTPGPSDTTKKPKKKKSKRKRDPDDEQSSTIPPEGHDAKRLKPRIPETVVDPSLSVPSRSSPHKEAKTDKSAKPHKTKSKETGDDDKDRFKDSRGTGPRRRTEEGFSIYKEDELGITAQGGDTPLCPFDCQCCF